MLNSRIQEILLMQRKRIIIVKNDTWGIPLSSVLDWMDKNLGPKKKAHLLEDSEIKEIMENGDVANLINILGDALGTPCALDIFDEINCETE